MRLASFFMYWLRRHRASLLAVDLEVNDRRIPCDADVVPLTVVDRCGQVDEAHIGIEDAKAARTTRVASRAKATAEYVGKLVTDGAKTAQENISKVVSLNAKAAVRALMARRYASDRPCQPIWRGSASPDAIGSRTVRRAPPSVACPTSAVPPSPRASLSTRARPRPVPTGRTPR